MGVWFWLAVREGVEQRAARQAGQAPPLPARQIRRNSLDAAALRRHIAAIPWEQCERGSAMRRFAVAAGVACAALVVDTAGAQTGGLSMPGQVVGSYSGTVRPVAQKLPAAAPQAGLPVTSNPLMRPYDPAHPYDALKGTNLDANAIVAPLVGADGRPVEPPDALDRLSEKIKAILAPMKPNPPRPPFAPGILRRKRERIENRMWRRD
jgi:hypothetical protein